jgi:sensor histidine kinase YesM
MSDEKAIYWLSQVGGWFGFVLLILFQSLIEGNVDVGIVKVLILNFVIGIGLSHTMRYIIVQYGMLEMKVLRVMVRVVLLSVVFSILASLIYASISDLFFTDVEPILVPPYLIILQLIFPFSIIFLFWNILYFAAIYLKNYEREEVKNLRLTASITEVELNNLRSQLNPHFMFNALNSIRALVDENPVQAKKSITQMSNILRNSMIAGKKRFVELSEELKVVKDYLGLEKIRFEERLQFEIKVPPELYHTPIPPLLIQTLAENAIKHGISHLPEGGKIGVYASETPEGKVEIRVCNSGRYDPFEKRRNDSHGIGLTNSRRRLNILYGDHATLQITNEAEGVVCTVVLPLEKHISHLYENHID